MNCLNNKGIAKTCKKKTPITTERAMFLTVPGFAFADAVEFADRDTWLGYIADGSILPLQGIREVENQNFEDPIIETTSGEKIGTFEGQRGSRYKLLFPLDQHQLVRLLNDGEFGVIIADRNNNLRGTMLDDGTITGFTTSFFKVWKMDSPAADVAPWTMIDVQYDDPDEWDAKGVYLTPTWRVSRIDGVLQVVTSSSAIVAGVFTTTVKYIDATNPTSAGATNEKAIPGLLVNNFKVYNQAGALLTPTTDYTVTESTDTPGEYEVDTTAGTPITGGTVQVIATATALYNSEAETLT